jgi:ribosomal protein S12 methylthiotransferase accessory factor
MIWISLVDSASVVVPWEDGLLFESHGKTLRYRLGCKSDRLFFLASILRRGGLLSDILFFAANHHAGARTLLHTIKQAVRSGFLDARWGLRFAPISASGSTTLRVLRALLASQESRGTQAEEIFYYDSNASRWQGIGWIQHKVVGRQHLLAVLRCASDTLLISIPRDARFCLECAFRWLVGNSPRFTESLARLRYLGAGRPECTAQHNVFEESGNKEFLDKFLQQLDQPAIALLFNNGKAPQSHHGLLEHPSCSCAGRRPMSLKKAAPEPAPANPVALAAHLTNTFVGPCHPVHSFAMTSATVGDATYYLAKATVNSAYRSGFARPLTCFGDGETATVATIRCVAEAIERFALMHYSKVGWVTASPAQLGNRVAQACRLSWYTDEQYLSPGFAYAPAAESEVREWVPCVDLNTKQNLYVWPELVYPSYQPVGRKPIVATSSTGTAVHSTLTDALVNAALEVIERDALALYFFTNVRPIEIMCDSLDSAQVQQVGRLVEAGFAVRVLFLESDVKIPTVLVIATRENKNPYFLKGASAGMSVSEACERAMREVWRSFVLYEHMGASPPLPGQVPPTSTEYNLAAYQVPGVLEKLGALGAPMRQIRLRDVEIPKWRWESIVTHLHSLGMQAVYVECTTDAIRRSGLFAVKVIVSGLVPVSFALQPKSLGLNRIYEFPLRLGQRDRRLKPAEINQSVHFFS